MRLPTKGIGGRGNEVYTIPFLDPVMVVSDSPQDWYDTTRANTVQHQLVCEEVLKQGAPFSPSGLGRYASPRRAKTVQRRRS